MEIAESCYFTNCALIFLLLLPVQCVIIIYYPGKYCHAQYFFFFGLKYGDSDFSIHLPWNDKNSTSFVFRIQWHVCYVILDIIHTVHIGSFWNGKDISKFPWHILHLYHCECDINISTWRDQANISYVDTSITMFQISILMYKKP